MALRPQVAAYGDHSRAPWPGRSTVNTRKRASMTSSNNSNLLYDVRSGVAWLTMNRPEKLNAFTPELYRDIKWAVRHASADDQVDIIVLTGTGRAFSAGGDLTESLRRLEAGGLMAVYDFADSAPFNDIRDTPKTVIAAVNGACYAGGLVAAMYCDLSVATDSALFALTEARIGLADDFAPAVLFGRTPTPRIKHLLFTGAAISAREAVELGLIGEVVAAGEFADRISALIEQIRTTSPVARAHYKKYLNDLMPRPSGNGGIDIYKSSSAIEGLRAFAESRRPDFTPNAASL